MNFSLRKTSDFALCKLTESSTTIEFGFLDNNEARKLLTDFVDAVEQLEWFVKTTDKEPT